MGRTVVTLGGYGYADVGDEAMLSSNLVMLREKIPRVSIVAVSDNPEHTTRLHGIPAVPSVQTVWRQSLTSRGMSKLSPSLHYRLWSRALARSARSFLLGASSLRHSSALYRLLDCLSRCDVVLNVGGGNLTSWFPNELRAKACTYHLAETFGKPIVVSGQGIGPFTNELDRRIAREALSKPTLITLRDPARSEKCLRELEVVGPRTLSTVDDAAFLPAAEQGALERTCEDYGIDTCGPLLMVNVRFGQTARPLPVFSALASVCDVFISEHNGQVVFVPMQYLSKPRYDDRVAARQVSRLMKNTPRTVVVTAEERDDVLKALIGLGLAAIGMRYHFAVFALTSGVPTIALSLNKYYDQKLSGVMQQFGQNGFCLTADPVDNDILHAKLNQVITERIAIRRRLLERLRGLQEHRYVVICHVAELLQDS